jgi:hypothetical protein
VQLGSAERGIATVAANALMMSPSGAAKTTNNGCRPVFRIAAASVSTLARPLRLSTADRGNHHGRLIGFNGVIQRVQSLPGVDRVEYSTPSQAAWSAPRRP